MTDIHRVLGLAVIGLAVALLATASTGAMLGGRLAPRLRGWMVDGLALATEAMVLAALVLGLPVLVAGPGPADPLHFLYAALALAALPVALGVALARGLLGAARDRWLALGAIVLVGVAVRLLQTG